jgi:phage antirepressor YoqD-like protein
MEKLEAERQQELQRQQRQNAAREPKINFVCLTSAMAL